MKSTIARGAAAMLFAWAALPSVVRADPPESHVQSFQEPPKAIPAKIDAVHPFGPRDSPLYWVLFVFAIYFGIVWLLLWGLDRQKIYLRM